MRKLFLLLSILWILPAYAVDVHTAIAVISCESSGRYDAVGDGGKSVGIAQFQKATFNRLKKEAHMPNLIWKNPVHQMKLMVWAIDHGYGHLWTCYRNLQKKHAAPIATNHELPHTIYVDYPARKDPDYNELIDYN